MLSGPDFYRSAKPEEFNEIEALLLAAFGQADEAVLVRCLRADGDIWTKVVVAWQDVLAGYAALSRMRAPEGWACLAPVAVLPRFQKQAADPRAADRKFFVIGTNLVSMLAGSVRINQGFREEGNDAPSTILVLGKPGFYERAGFSLARAQKLTSPYPIEFTLISRSGEDIPEETLVYPPAFGG